ncbi:hypothetical protein F3Y22_tig00110548pilonHSYRG00113 [Hibiscus syriacus]|uniref:Uncharacterized protein n=1 Tax=Hibiscus syriacus TaxID=106335 RepID=A0A6A3A9D0_HIBSY|nr:hypothetical protein F3Y22_tig00110548pilonHSYRG00113 [Hibiscus syriacus]
MPNGDNAHATTLKLLETLKSHSCNKKVVLALAAFTANLGEYMLLLQRGNTNSLSSSVAFLRQVSEIEHLNALTEEVTKLVQAIRNLEMLNAKLVMKLHQWNTSLTTEAGKELIIQLENEVSQIYAILKHHYNSCKVYIGKEIEDAYQSLLKLMQRPGGGDIVEILNRFLGGQGKKTDSYEIVWLPVVDGLYNQQKFMKLKGHMKCPIAVFLTPEGEVTCQNALPLLWTWGNQAFPFTAEAVKTLWHIAEGKLVCLYGGGSMDWIQQFTAGIKVVFARIGVTVEMVYVCKNNAKVWTGKGKEVIVRMEGETALNIKWKYGNWENYAKRYGFLQGLGYYMEDQIIPHSCFQLKLPFVSSEIPGKVECCERGSQMDLYYIYLAYRTLLGKPDYFSHERSFKFDLKCQD